MKLLDLFSRSEAFRRAWFSAAFVILFALSFLSDLYKALLVPSIAFSAILLAVSLYALFRVGRNARKILPTEVDPVKGKVETKVYLGASVNLRRYEYYNAILSMSEKTNSQMLYAVLSSNSGFKSVFSEDLEKMNTLREASWDIVSRGKGEFTILAGSVQIENHLGTVNIRIIDPSKVTLETEKRGIKPAGAPLQLRAGVYH